MDDRDKDDALLDALFASGKSQSVEASSAFLSKLEMDMEAAIPKPKTAATKHTPPSMMEKLKGIFAATGLSSAAALGVWMGFVMPDLVTNISPISEEVTSLSAFLPGSDLSVFEE
ncbi:MAG: hypothetical protein AAF718_01850 [Pseudomonadota bacterium]